MTPTAEQIEASRTANGGWTRAQLAEWGISWPPPKGWRERLIDRGHKNGGPRKGPDDESRREYDASFGAFGVIRRLKPNTKIPPVGKCDHERVHQDEDGKRCLYCAAWL